MSRSNIYLACNVHRDYHIEAMERNQAAKGKPWPLPRDAKMAQMPDVHLVKWQEKQGDLPREDFIRADAQRAKRLGINVLAYDWEPRVNATTSTGGTIKVPPTSYVHLSREQQEESDHIWQREITDTAEWIHQENPDAQFGLYDVPVTFGDKNLGIASEIQSVLYNAARCSYIHESFSKVEPGALQAVDYFNPVMYRPPNFNLELDRHPSWSTYVVEMSNIMKTIDPGKRVISWFWGKPHPHADPRPDFPEDEWAKMLADLLSIGDIMVHCEGYDELKTDNYIFGELWNQWNKCVA